jgi:hypothetical protein
MKVFQDQEFEYKGIKSRYKDLMEQSINFVKQGAGLNVSEMRKRQRLLDVIEASNGSGRFEFEDQDFENLKKCVLQTDWNVLDKNIIAFTDAIEAVK